MEKPRDDRDQENYNMEEPRQNRLTGAALATILLVFLFLVAGLFLGFVVLDWFE